MKISSKHGKSKKKIQKKFANKKNPKIRGNFCEKQIAKNS